MYDPRPMLRPLGLLLAALLASPLPGCGDADGLSRDPARFDVLIVVLDSLRVDAVGAYGNERQTTPNLDALAADPDAAVFRRHYAPAAWTKPSTASLFTGVHPSGHGVLEPPRKKKDDADWSSATTQALGADFLTLAEVYQRAGFSTFGVVKSRHLVPEYGFAQGFDEYRTPEDLKSDAERVRETLRLAGASRGRFFGYLHLSAAHLPWRAKDRDAEFMERHGFPYDEAARREAGIDFASAELQNGVNRKGVRLEPDDVRFLRLVYEATVARMDRETVAALVAGLRERGRYDTTLLIVTADHGAELYEHQGYSHGHALWEQVVHVPLIVKFPRGRRPAELSGERTDVTSTVDLYPSLLRAIGVPTAARGRDLFRGESPNFAFAEIRGGHALVRGGFKLIADGEDEHMYDLRQDPGEASDVAASESAALEKLRALARAVQSAAGGVVAPEIEAGLDEAAIRELKELGYIR